MTRSHTLPRPTDRTDDILYVARRLLSEAGPLIRRGGLTLVGVAVANLDDADAVQLVLPLGRRHRARVAAAEAAGRDEGEPAPPASAGGMDALDAALDDVRSRFGTAALTRAVLLGRHDHLDVPLLPD